MTLWLLIKDSNIRWQSDDPLQTGKYQTLTLKNPMTATSLSAIRDSAAVTSVRVATAGPVRFFSQLTMSSACLPAAAEQKDVKNFSIVTELLSLRPISSNSSHTSHWGYMLHSCAAFHSSSSLLLSGTFHILVFNAPLGFHKLCGLWIITAVAKKR